MCPLPYPYKNLILHMFERMIISMNTYEDQNTARVKTLENYKL